MPEEIILALDTTSSPLFAAVYRAGKTAGVKKSGIKQEEFLFPSIKKALSKTGADLKDVTKVFFIKGPGRFTGIRIALTTATMLRSLNNAEASSATMFEVLRRGAEKSREYKTWLAKNPGGHTAVILHAFREEYFLQICGLTEPLWMTKEGLFKYISGVKMPLFIIGFDKDRAPLDELFKNFNYALGSAKLSRVTPALLTEVAKEKNFEPGTLEPLYLKPARFELGK
ncbi:MAG: tRNA (adenosine(37)-N6)-threonylcarbamoyltransferase complex dimerization subunit type 1 TsaB [Elusimicrobium sp.]|jgi:tRNA threonylcarbamoyl adenosine modification protein YeaZ|nr:tRNA (adenosine(37)-N6)-threonylcarbamoyltransferase complex dimerization subunit type 1 TsaB [Elusimicrobium sp.]